MAAPAWTRPGLLRAWLLGTTALLPAAGGALAQGVAPNTLPTGGQVSAGAASITQSGSAMQVTQGSNRAAINWQGFSVGANASVNFQQPSAGAWTLNRVVGADPSVIAGRITANGGVAIVNQSGVVFAAGAQVNVGSLIASAANITNDNFMAGKMVFDGPPRPGATVENHGSITIADRGLAALVGPRVANSGTIRARLGRVALAGAETFSIDLAGDGLLSIDVTQAVRTAANGSAALVTNSGVIEAQGGSVLLSAHAASGLVEDLVRNTGSIAANSAAGRSGQVALRAEGGGVRVEGSISATGRGRQSGGSIELRGSTATTVAGSATVDASGGAGGGRVLVGTTGVGRDQTMSATTTVERGARIGADARRRGNGGTVAVNSTASTVVNGSVSVRGGRQGGNGGLVELSGQRALSIAAQVDVKAPAGRRGTILLDPRAIEVVADADAPADAGAPLNTVTASTGASGTVLKVRASDLDAAANVTLQASETILISAAVNIGANTLNLFADGAITQSATITAGTLVIRGFAGGSSAAGSATLNLANSIGTLDAIATGALSLNNGATGLTVTNAQGSAVTLTTTGTLGLNGAVGGSGAAVALHVDGTISQTGGSITAASLTVRDSTGGAATAGDINLGRTNSLAAIDLASTSGVTLVNDGTALAVAGLVTPVAAIATDGDIAFTGATQVSNGLSLFTNGNVGQSGTGAVGTLLLTIADRANFAATPGSVNLGTLTNAIGAVDIRATGAVTINNGGNALLLTRATGSGIAITAGGLTVPGAAVVQASGGGTISLRVDSLAWGGLLDAGTTGTLEIGPRSNATTVSLGAGGAGALQVDPGSFDATRLVAGTFTVGETTIGASTLRGNGLVVSGAVAPDAATVATALRLVADTGTAISVEAPVGMAGRAVALLGSGSIGQTAAGKITAATLEVGAPGGGAAGAVTLNAVANALGRASIASSGTVLLRNDATALTLGGLSGTGATITTAATLTVDGAIGLGAGTLNLFADGAIGQASGVITAGSVVVRNAAGAAATTQAVALDGASNAIAAIDIASTSSVAVRNGATDLVVTALSGSGATLTTAGALAFDGAANLGAGTLTIRASGAVTQANTAVITAATLNTRDAAGATSAAAVTLDTASNAIGSLDGATTAAFALKTTPALTVAGLAAQSATLTSGAGVSVTGAVTITDGLAVNATSLASSAVVTAGSLTLRGPNGVAAVAGAIDLGTTENAIGTLDAKSGTSILVRNGSTDLVVTQAVAPTVRLDGRGNLSIAGLLDTTGGTGATLQFTGNVTSTGAASIRGPALGILGFGGGDAASIDLSLGSHVLDAYAGHATGLNRIAQAGDLIVSAATGSTIDIASTAGVLSLAGAIGGSGAAVTLAARTDLAQTAGVITAATLSATSTTTKLDLQQANLVASADLGAATTLDFISASALTVTGAAGTIVTLAAPSLSLTGAVGGTTRVQLTSSAGGIGQGGAGIVTTPDLRLTVTGGDAVLTLANAVDQFRASAAGQAVRFTSANDLTLAGAISGTTVAIIGRSILAAASQNPSVALDLTTTAGSITQTGGVTLRADTMNFVAVGGDILLGGGDHVAANAGFSAPGHAVIYNQVDDLLTVTGASAATITITAPAIELAGAVGATTSLALTTTGGAITQTAAGAITTPRLTAIAVGGAVDLGTANDPSTGNSIGQLGAASSTAGVAVVSRTAMEIHAAGIGITAAAGATIALEAPGLAINQAVGFTAANAGNLVTLTADALTATAAIDAGASGRVAIASRSASRGIDIGGTTANTLQLGAATLGQVTAGRLLISTTGTTAIGLNADLALAGVGTLELRAGTGIAQDHATGITVASLAATAAAGSIDLGGVNQIGAIAGSLADATTGLSATGSITLVNAAALAVGARVLAGNGQTIAITASDLTTSAGIATGGSSAANRIDLHADTLVLGADVTAAGGVINILPDTGGRSVRIGGADGVLANTLYLPTSQFRFIQAADGLLRIGGTAATTTAGTITLGGEVPLRASVSGGAVVAGSAATLDLRGAAVATDPGVVFGLNVAGLTGTTSGGFRLDRLGNAIDSLGAIGGNTVTVFSDLALTANGPIDGGAGRVSLGSAGQLTLAGDILAGTSVALGADAAILQTGGRIVSPIVEAGAFNSGATAITLLRSGNDFGAFAATASGAVQVFSTAATAGTLSLTGPVTGASVAVTSGGNLDTSGGVVTATGGAIRLTAAGTLTLGNNLAATGDITLLANLAAGTSAISQTAGSVRSSAAGTIGLTADTISLLAAPNSVGTAGLVTLRPLTDGRAITLGATVANTLSIASGAGISAGRVLIGRSEAGPITLGGSFGVGAATLELITAGAIGQAGGTVLTAGALSATAGGAITLDGQNLIDAVAGSTADAGKGLISGGSIALTTASAGGLTTSAAIAAATGGSITLRADALALGATVGASSGSLAALNILPNTPGTAVTLGADAAGLALNGSEIGFLRAGTGTLRIGGDGSGVTAGAITLAGDVMLRGGSGAAAVLDLRGASVAQTAGGLAVATVTGATSAGGFALGLVNQIDSLGLTGAGNTVAVGATGGSVSIASANALTVRGDVTAAAASGSGTAGVSLRGNGLAIGDDTAPAKPVLVQAGRGDVVLDAGSGALTTTAVTTLRAQDPASLAAEGTGSDLFGNIRLGGGTVTLAGTLDASRASGGRDIGITATDALDLGGVAWTARRDLGLASSAGGLTVQTIATLAAGRDITLTSLGAMQVDGTLIANRSIGVTSTAGSVGLTGTLTAAAIGPGLAEAGAGITISGATGATLDGSLTATGRSIQATAVGGTLNVLGALSAASGGAITLNAIGSDGRVLVAAAGTLDGGTVTANATRQLQVLGSIGGTDIALTVGPSATPFAPAFEAGSGSSIIASGSLGITANSGTIGLTAATLQAGTTLGLTAAAGGITQTRGSTTAAGAVTLQAATGITVTANGGAAPVLRSTGASLSLTTGGGDVALTDATLSAATSLGITASAGGITQTRGSTTAAGSLIWQAASGIGVTNGGGAAPSLGSSGGSLALTTSGGDLRLTEASVTAATTLGLTATAGAVTQIGGTTSGAGAVTLQAGTGIVVAQGSALGPAVVTGLDTLPVLRSTGAGLGLSTTAGDIVLTQATLSAAAGIGATAGTDATQGGNIAITGGSVIAGTGLALSAVKGSGGANAGTLTATATTLTGGTTTTLLAGGGLTATSSTLRATAGAFAATTTTGTLLLDTATLAAGTTLALAATAGDLTQTGGSITAGSILTLTSGGDTTQLAGGRIIAPVLTGSAGGSVALINGATLPGALVAKASGNSITAIAGYTAGGDLTLASNVTPLQVTGLVGAGAGRALRLFADDLALTAGLAAPGGSVTLSPYTRDGSIALVLGGSSGASTANTLTLDSAELALLPVGGIGSLRFGRTDNPAGLTDIAGATIAGAADLSTTVARLELNSRGAITQNAGTSLVVPLLAATAGGDIALDPGSSANRIGGLAGIQTPGSFGLRTALVSGAAMTIGAGSATAGDAGASSFGDGILVGSGRTITLRADDLAIGAAVRAPSGSITLMADTSGRGITLGGAGAGTLSLSAAEVLLLGGDRSGSLDSGAATLLRVDASTVPGSIAIAGPVDLQGPTARFQALELLASANVAGSGGAITVPVLRATVAGDLVLDNAGNRFLLNRISAANATIRQAGDLRLANAVASLGGVIATGGISAPGGTVRLISGGTITQDSGATVTAGTLALSAGNTVTLEEANAFGTLADVGILGGGASRLRAANFTVAGPVSVTGGLRLLADTGLGATGSIATSGTLALATTLGDIVLGGATLTAGGGLTMTAGSSPTSGGDIAVTGGSIGVTGAAVLTATRDGTLANPGDIGLSGTSVTASTDLALAAGGCITGGSSALAATNGAFAATAATGSIGLSGTTAGGGTTATLTAATGLTVTGGGIAANGGALAATTTTGDLTLDTASLTATGTLGLTATAGSISQRRGTTSGGDRTRLLAQTGITVTADGGAAPILRSTGERLVVNTTFGSIALTGVTASAGTDALVAGGAVSITGGSLLTGAGAQVSASAGTIGLSGTSLTAATDLSLQASLGITAGSTTLAATGGTLGANTAAGDIGFTTVTASSGGNLGLTASTGAVTLTGSTATAGGGATLLGGTGVSLATSGVTTNGGALAVSSTAGDIGLTGSSLTGNGASGTVTVIAGTASAQGGDVTIAGSTLAGRSLTLQAATGSGGANAGDLAVAGSSLTGALAATLQAGGTLAVTGGSVAATSGLLTIAAMTGAATLDSTALAGQGIGISAGGMATLRRGAATSGAGLSIAGGTGVTITADGGAAPVITAGPFSVTTGGGDIMLTGAQVQAGATEFRAGNGGVLGGDIGITGGSLSADALVLTAIAGTGNAGTIGLNGTAISAGGGASLTAAAGIAASATTLGVGGALAATTAAGALGLDTSTVTATGTLALTATTGAITQRRGTTSGGGAVALQAGSGIAVTADGGAAPVLRSTGASLAATTTTGGLALTGATLSAATGLGLTATAGAIGIGGSGLTAGTDATLGAATGLSATASTLSAGTALAATTAAGALALSDATVGAGTTLGLAATSGAVTIAGSGLTAGTAASLTAGGGITLTASTLTTGGPQSLTAGGTLSATGSSLTASGNQAFAAGTGLTLAGSSIATQGSLAATTGLGAATLTDAILAAAGSLSLTATAGALTQTRGSLTGGGDTRLRGGAGVTLTDAGSGTAPILRSSGGSLSVAADGGNVVLANARLAAASGLGITAGGGIGATDSSLATAAGTLRLVATAGDLILLRGTLASTAGDLDLTAGAAGSLTATSLSAPSPSGRVRVVTGGPLTLRGLAVTADAADFEAGRLFPADAAAYGRTRAGSLLVNDGITATIGTKLLFAGPGGITDLGLTLVLPRATALPAVLYDTRLNPAVNPLGQVQPDVAGLPASQQATQVRSAPGALSPGAFGLPDQATAAGAVTMNVNAGQSAVFLLVDGGNIQGNIVAGRLGVHGAGGTMSILGTLGGSPGAQAARFADITRPIPANELQRYRINGCVVSSVNCVVPPSIQIIPPRPTDRASFTLENNRINTSEVLIPNIAEEDED